MDFVLALILTALIIGGVCAIFSALPLWLGIIFLIWVFGG